VADTVSRIVRVYVAGRTETLHLDSRRYCLGCQHWTPRLCRLLGVELPGYASPSRPAVCIAAEGEARARARRER